MVLNFNFDGRVSNSRTKKEHNNDACDIFNYFFQFSVQYVEAVRLKCEHIKTYVISETTRKADLL